MTVAARVKKMLLAPKEEWPNIAGEYVSARALFTNYVMVLAAMRPLVAFVRSAGEAVLAPIGDYVVALATVAALAFVADVLAPYFGGARAFPKSLALVAYSSTAWWIGGAIASAVPVVHAPLMLAALIYGFYTLNAGAPPLGRAAADKAAGYTIVMLLCAIAIAIVLGVVVMPRLFGTTMMKTGTTWI